VQLAEESLAKEETTRKDLEGQLAKLLTEKNDIFMQLQQEKGNLQSLDERSAKLTAQKADLEKQVNVSTSNMLLCLAIS